MLTDEQYNLWKSCIDAEKHGYNSEDDNDIYKFDIACDDVFAFTGEGAESDYFFKAVSRADFYNNNSELYEKYGKHYVVKFGVVYYIINKEQMNYLGIATGD